MKYVLTPEQMYAADQTVSEQFGIPPLLLMENAALSASDIIVSLLSRMPSASVVVFCGSGNNGGDGFALARHLAARHNVQIYWIGEEGKMSHETHTNFTIAHKLGLKVVHLVDTEQIAALEIENCCLIDALIGVGGSGQVRGLIVSLLQKINISQNLKIAIDISTGLNALTGQADEHCFRADHTITMGALKAGLLLQAGPDVSGMIHIGDFGLPSHLVASLSTIHILEKPDIRAWLPKRKRMTSKFDYGNIVLIGGSGSMPGSIVLSANAAITAGAGLVRLFTPLVHPAVKPEIMTTIVPSTSEGTISEDARATLLQAVENASVVVIGPGLGKNEETIQMCREVLSAIPSSATIVVDADGLRCIDSSDILDSRYILTPHLGEFSRLTGIPREEVQLRAPDLAKEWAQRLQCSILLKYVPAIITNGSLSYWNTNGNPGMATAGSGDVLTGIIAGLAGQGLSAFQSAALGAFLHAAAGDIYAAAYGEETLTATSLIDCLQNVLHGVRE